MTTHEFKNVWYRTDLQKPQNPDRAWDNPTRQYDKGTLTIHENMLEFMTPGKPTVAINAIRNVTIQTRVGAKFVKVEYGTGLMPQTAYLGMVFTGLSLLMGAGKKQRQLFAALKALGRSGTGYTSTASAQTESLVNAVQRVVTYAVQRKISNLSEYQIEKNLADLGLKPKMARIVIEGLSTLNKSAKAGQRHIWIGALLFIGGIVVTVATYNAVAGSGGTYVVAYGAILFGGLEALGGLFQYLSAPRGQEAQTRLTMEHVLKHVNVEDAPVWKAAADQMR